MTFNLHRFSTLVHKWMGLLIGLQVLLWIAGGVVMSWYDLERVRGEHNISKVEIAPLPTDDILVPVSQILAAAGQPAASVTLRRLGYGLVYDLEEPRAEPGTEPGEEPSHVLFDAKTGQRLSPLPAETALAVALADFAGTADPDAPQLLEVHNLEYRGPLPVWRVVLNDEEDTRLYVSPETGLIISRRNSVWRLYDFFWMLHIMDYENRTDFNNPLLIFFSITALLFAVAGIVLIFYRFSRRDFAWLQRTGADAK